jgi:hypothetical protein
LRERQGLKRFHRRGLKSVRIEFALHRIALNRKKAVSLFILWLRFPPASWHLLRAAFVFALPISQFRPSPFLLSAVSSG